MREAGNGIEFLRELRKDDEFDRLSIRRCVKASGLSADVQETECLNTERHGREVFGLAHVDGRYLTSARRVLPELLLYSRPDRCPAGPLASEGGVAKTRGAGAPYPAFVR